MVVRNTNRQQQQQQRKAARQTLGKLANLTIQKKTAERYEMAVMHFFQWTANERRSLRNQADTITAAEEWVEECWAEGDSLSVAADTLSGLQHFLPDLKGHLRQAWRLIGAWRKQEIPRRAPPFLRVMIEALVAAAVERRPLCSFAFIRIRALFTDRRTSASSCARLAFQSIRKVIGSALGAYEVGQETWTARASGDAEREGSDIRQIFDSSAGARRVYLWRACRPFPLPIPPASGQSRFGRPWIPAVQPPPRRNHGIFPRW